MATLEERMAKIENKSRKDKEAAKRKEEAKRERIEVAMQKIRDLEPRIQALIQLVNKCKEEGIKVPDHTSKFGYGEGYRTYNFFTDGIHHHVGFVEERKMVSYIGINNGGWNGPYDFYTNGDEIFTKHENSGKIRAIDDFKDAEKFLEEFGTFEQAFYNWIDSLE